VTFLSGDVPPSQGLGHPAVTTIGLGQARLLTRPARDALVTGWWNRTTLAMVRAFIAAHDTPGTVYHLHGWSQILSPAIFAALAPVRARLILSAHDFFLVCPNGAYADMTTGTPCTHTPLGLSCITARCDRRGRAQKLWRVGRAMIQRVALSPANCPPVLAIHAAMASTLIRGGIPADAIHVLPNPVVPWSPSRVRAEINQEVLFVGRLETTKGGDLALAAARLAGVPMRVIGDGAMAAQWRAKYPEAEFDGRQDPAAIARLARRARVLVMPSRYPEPFGLVAIEALRSGLPVVLPPSALLADDITRMGAGATVEPRDTSAFAALLRHLADDDATIRAMSKAAFVHSPALALDPATWIERLLGHYRARLTDAAIQRARPAMATVAAVA
jgi:glycosyltransferase involved in cell wall biosynthesis